MPKSKESQEFSEKKILIKLQKEFEKYKHRLIMEELKYRRESSRLYHENELTRGRIKSAEIKKTIAMKDRSR